MNRNNAKFFLLAVAALLLSACATPATQAQKQAQQMKTTIGQVINNVQICYSARKKDDAYQRINQIYILDENDPNALRKMMIDRYASEEEKEDFLKLQVLHDPCRRVALKGFGKVHPEMATLIASFYAENDELRAKLLKDKLTIGEANEIINNRIPKRKNAYNGVTHALHQQLNNSHQSEIKNRQRASAALQQTLYQQQILLQNQQAIDAARRPVNTHCSGWGNSINCTSR